MSEETCEDDGIDGFSFDEMQGIRWKIVGSGSAWPEGRTTAYFEWENGIEASFSSYSIDMQTLADEWMDAHEDGEWCGDPLPDWLVNDAWVSVEQD